MHNAQNGGVIKHFLRFSKTGTMLPIRYIFMSPIPKISKFIFYLLFYYLLYDVQTGYEVVTTVSVFHPPCEPSLLCDVGAY